MILLWCINIDFDVTHQLLYFVSYNCRKKWIYNGTIHQLFTDFKKAHNSIGRFYIIFLYFGIPMKLVRLIKMCLKCKV